MPASSAASRPADWVWPPPGNRASASSNSSTRAPRPPPWVALVLRDTPVAPGVSRRTDATCSGGRVGISESGVISGSEQRIELGQRKFGGRRRLHPFPVDVYREALRVDVDPRQRVIVDHLGLADPAGGPHRRQPAP